MEPLSSLFLSSPNARHTSIYSNLLSSSSHIPKLSLISTLGPTAHYPGAGHKVVKSAWGHTGCVNTMHWEEGGLGRLASGGDDTKICIWQPGLEPRPSNQMAGTGSSESFVSRPAMDFGLSTTLETGHRANIFSVKWAPHNSDRLISCAGDSEVRVFDLSTTSSATPVYSGNRSWNHLDSTCCIKVIKCHTDRVKKIAVEDTPDTFLSCSEDGTVRQHDLRTPHTCSGRNRRSATGISPSTSAIHGNSTCPEPLVSYNALSLYSLSISKARPYMFVVGGTSRWAFLHDRRMIRSSMRDDWNIEMDDSLMTQCVRRFGVPQPFVGESGRAEYGERSVNSIGNHVVATKLSDSNPTELLVSYSDDSIYLFDTDADPLSSRTDFDTRMIERIKYQDDLVEEEKRRKEATASKQSLRHEEGVSADPSQSQEVGMTDGAEVGTTSNKRRRTSDEAEEVIPASEERVEESDAISEEDRALWLDRAGLTEIAGELARRMHAEDVDNDDDEIEDDDEDEEEDDDLGMGPFDVDRAADEDEEDIDESSDFGGEEDDTEDGEDDSDDDDDDEDEDEEEDEAYSMTPASDLLDAFTRHHSSPSFPLPLIAPRKEYKGHINVDTVKDVNFAYQENCVMSGSDDGNWFVWDKETEELKGIFDGDSSVVNVLQCHPFLPLIAISGIDNTLKLFGPSSDPTNQANQIERRDAIIKRNARGNPRNRVRHVDDGESRALFALIQARMAEMAERGGFAPGELPPGVEGECLLM